MRKVVIMKRAENALFKVALYRAEQYFPETGEKFINEFIDFCIACANLKVKFPYCKHKTLSKYKYSCFVFKKKWIVAFKYNAKEMIIYRIIWGPNLK